MDVLSFWCAGQSVHGVKNEEALWMDLEGNILEGVDWLISSKYGSSLTMVPLIKALSSGWKNKK